jgi:Meiotically up-regulated gene 113
MQQQVMFPIESRRRKRILYCLVCGDFVKIGYTDNPIRRRVAQMETGNPSRIQVIGTREIPDHEDDRPFHDRARQFHYRKEWYHKTPELLALIDEFLYGPEILIKQQIPQIGAYVIWFNCPCCGNAKFVGLDIRAPFELRFRSKCPLLPGDVDIDRMSQQIFGDCWRGKPNCNNLFRVHLIVELDAAA